MDNKLTYKNIYLLMLILVLAGCGKTLNSSLDDQHTNRDIVDSYKYLNDIEIEKKVYRVYTLFLKVKTANSYLGRSFLVFSNAQDTVGYAFDMPDQLPDTLIGNKLIFKADTVYLKAFDDYLCAEEECFERTSLWPLRVEKG